MQSLLLIPNVTMRQNKIVDMTISMMNSTVYAYTVLANIHKIVLLNLISFPLISNILLLIHFVYRVSLFSDASLNIFDNFF